MSDENDENNEEIDNTEEIDTLKAQLAEKEEALKLRDEEITQAKEDLAKKEQVDHEKAQNFAALRKKAEGSEKLKSEIDLLKEQVQNVAQANIKDVIDEYVLENVGASKEDQDIFNKHFKVLSAAATSKVEFKQALENAKVLFDKDKGNLINPTGQILRTQGRPIQGSSDQESDFSRESRKQMGLSDEDYKKYGHLSKEWEKAKL